METIKMFLKFILLPSVLVIIFNFIEYGFLWDKFDKFLYPGILMSVFMVNFLIPRVRRYFLILAFVILLLMVLLYLLNNLDLSNRAGSFGFALLLIVVVSYLPDMIKKGYLEKF